MTNETRVTPRQRPDKWRQFSTGQIQMIFARREGCLYESLREFSRERLIAMIEVKEKQ
jgi:hypothetical protein